MKSLPCILLAAILMLSCRSDAQRNSFSSPSPVIQLGSIPRDFVLEQNYPNPFARSTTIRYGVPHRCSVTLKVVDLLGEEIACLVHDEHDAGVFEVVFDGTRFASGVYFYQLEAEDFCQVRTLSLVK